MTEFNSVCTCTQCLFVYIVELVVKTMMYADSCSAVLNVVLCIDLLIQSTYFFVVWNSVVLLFFHEVQRWRKLERNELWNSQATALQHATERWEMRIWSVWISYVAYVNVQQLSLTANLCVKSSIRTTWRHAFSVTVQSTITKKIKDVGGTRHRCLQQNGTDASIEMYQEDQGGELGWEWDNTVHGPITPEKNSTIMKIRVESCMSKLVKKARRRNDGETASIGWRSGGIELAVDMRFHGRSVGAAVSVCRLTVGRWLTTVTPMSHVDRTSAVVDVGVDVDKPTIHCIWQWTQLVFTFTTNNLVWWSMITATRHVKRTNYQLPVTYQTLMAIHSLLSTKLLKQSVFLFFDITLPLQFCS